MSKEKLQQIEATYTVNTGPGETVTMIGNYGDLDRITALMQITNNEWLKSIIENAIVIECLNCGMAEHIRIDENKHCVVCGKVAE